MTVLSSHADGIAEDLDRPHHSVRIWERDGVNGYGMKIETTSNHTVKPTDIEQLEESGWSFVCFKQDYALFEKGPEL